MNKRHSALQLIQSDVSINLFIILLVILVLLDFASVLATKEGFPLRINAEEGSEQDLALSASWRPVQPLRPKFLVRGETVYRLRTDMLARGLADPDFDPLKDVANTSNKSVPLNKDPDPSAYQILVYFFAEGVSDELMNYSFELTELDSAATFPAKLTADIDAHSAFDILAPNEHSENLIHLTRTLSQNRRQFEIKPVLRDGQIGFSRRSTTQGFEASFK